MSHPIYASAWVLIITIICVLTILIIRALWGIFILSQGAFYAGSTKERIKNILELAKVKKGEKAIDLGSGDGRLLIALAESGAQATGIELDPLLVRKSQKNVAQSKYTSRITIKFGNLWHHDLSQYDIIVIYGIKHMMPKLEKKLLKEARKDAHIISAHFTFPNLKPHKTIKDVHLYKLT